MGVERRNADGLATPPGYTHVAIAAGGSHEHQVAVWEAVQDSPFAAAPSTLLGVALLGYRGQLVEIEAVAVTDGEAQIDA